MKNTHDSEKALLTCFVEVARRQGKPLSSRAIEEEVRMMNKKLTPKCLVDLASRFSLSVATSKVSFKKLLSMPLPVIVALKHDQYGILKSVDAQNKTVSVQYPEAIDKKEDTASFSSVSAATSLSFEALESQYSGSCLTVMLEMGFEKRADEQGLFHERASWFWGTLWQYKYIYKHVIFAAIIINLLTLALPLFIMNVYDRVVPNNAVETLWVLAIGVLIALAADFTLKTLRAYFVDVANKHIDILLSSKLLGKSLNIVMSKQPLSTGVRADHLKDFESVRDFFSSITITGVVDLPFFFLFVGVIAYIGGPLFMIPLATGGLILILSILLSIPLYRYIRRTFVGSAQKTAILFESLLSVELIKSVSAFSHIVDRWRHYARKVADDALKSRFYSILALNLTIFLNALTSVLVVVAGVYLIWSGSLTMGGLIACVILVSRALQPLAQTASLLTRIQQVRCSLAALNEIMQSDDERSEKAQFLPTSSYQGGIAFDHVSFQYPDTPSPLLDDVTFSIKPGERVAILGSMASGKSTLLKLIIGFYRPTKGVISLDDIDIRQIDPIILRQHIGYLEQNPKLLFGTALSNILLKNLQAKEEAVVKAVKLSGADVFLNHHPNGFEMPIAEQGKGLSGGQIQTLALARTVLDDPPILLLDEPTSAMDIRTEEHFIHEMQSYMKNKTVIMVAHRKRLLDLVDRIIVLQKGKIVMDGEKQKVLNTLVKVNKEAYAHDTN